MTNPFVKFVPDSTEPRADEGFLPVWSWPQEKTVEFLKRLIDNEDIFDLYVGNQNDLTKAAKQILRALYSPTLPGFLDEGPKGNNPYVNYRGQSLPCFTIYDMLGYIFSVTGTLPPGQTDSPLGDYYMPLLCLYAKWCHVLAMNCGRGGQQNQHIAYFPAANDKFHVLLGSTMGPHAESEIRKYVVTSRIRDLRQAGFQDPPLLEDHKTNFGSCGETNFFIFARKSALPVNGAQGLAISTDEDEWVTINGERGYNEVLMSKELWNPCEQSCQVLLGQMGWSWQGCFDIKRVKNG